MPRSKPFCRLAALLLLPVPMWGQSPVGELFAAEPGALSVARPAGSGMSVLPGSELSAGIAPATLKLGRGGQVRICPSTNLSVNAAGQGLMLGMGAGAVEINYQLGPSVTDLLVTPDFNLRLAGPGVYRFALGVNSKGDTCFKPLPGNTSGVVFSELMGADSYGAAADESAVFSGGKLGARGELKVACGCAAPPAPVMRAGEQPELRETPGANLKSVSTLPAIAEVTAPLPAEKPGQTQVQVETPFVFSGAGSRPNTVARVQFSSLPNVFFAQETVDPVVLTEKPAEVSVKETKPAAPAEAVAETKKDAEAKKEKKGFLARLKGFFGSMFHR
jgi:hypothetical protein